MRTETIGDATHAKHRGERVKRHERRIERRMIRAQRWAARHGIPGPLTHDTHPEGREYACLCWQCFLARELDR